MSMMIQVRVGNAKIQFTHEQLQLVATAIVKESTGEYLAVEEKGKLNEGLHIHVFIWSDSKIQALRKRIMNKVPFIKGRGNYSIIPNEDGQPVLPVVQDMWKTYACKGEKRGVMPVILFNTMLSEEEVLVRHNKYWDMQAERNRLQPVSTEQPTVALVPMPEKKVRKRTVVEDVADILDDGETNWTMSHDHRRKVFDAVMKRLGRLGKTLDAVVVRRMCYGVHNILSPSECRDEIWSQIYPGEIY